MTLSKKLYAVFGAAWIISLIMGLTAIYNLSAMGGGVDALTNISARNLFLSSQISKSSLEILSSNRAMLLRAYSIRPEEVERFYADTQRQIEQLRRDDAEFVQRSTRSDLRETVRTQIGDRLDRLPQLELEAYGLIRKGDLKAAAALFQDKLAPLCSSMQDATAELTRKEFEQVSRRGDATLSLVGPARALSFAMMALSFAVGCVGIWVVRTISATLGSSVAELRDGLGQVANAASQVSSSSQSLAHGASEQAASLEQTSASSEEINSMARKNTDNSKSTVALLSQSQQKVTQANHYLQDMVASMDQITDSSGKISKIIKVIDEIAFQTNILALNAAVEAARAGEAGMGFAVVADEVRSLAQRSAQAAKDTAALIEDSIAKSNEGKVRVDQVAFAIQAVTEDSARIKVMVDEVSLGSEEQSRGIDQIGRSISQMEQVTQTTAATAEQSAAAAEELSAQSEALKDVLGRLQTMVGGRNELPRAARHLTHARSPARPARPTPVFRPPMRSAGSSRPLATFQPRNGERKPVPLGRKAVEPDEFPMDDNFQSF
jgi:methyl-accepting chemotaxis protein/methyl-accepting chemotaxis protein-1 (serine sensor receptor)